MSTSSTNQCESNIRSLENPRVTQSRCGIKKESGQNCCVDTDIGDGTCRATKKSTYLSNQTTCDRSGCGRDMNSGVAKKSASISFR
jgi:hypothetical protein